MSAVATEEKKSLLPPDEKFWQRYSPRYELPLAWMSSILAHAALFGLLFVIGVLSLLSWRDESRKPIAMAVMDVNPDGNGENGGGVIGSSNPGTKPETIATSSSTPVVPTQTASLEPAHPFTMDPLPPIPEMNPIPLDGSPFDTIRQDTKKELEKPPTVYSKPVFPGVGATTSGKGPFNPKGTGGQGDKGTGTGKGIGDGPGTGRPAGGVPLTKQQIFANRWRFDLEGLPREHAIKLASIGVTLAFVDPRGMYNIVTDLKQRPAVLKEENPIKWKNSVTWYNSDVKSVVGLALELKVRLNYTPFKVALLLSREREELLAEVEAHYAKERNQLPNRIKETHFDFVLQNGEYVPVVRSQTYN